MDERVRHMLELSVAVIIFLVAMDLFLGSSQITTKGLQQVYEVNASSDRDLKTTVEIEGQYQVTGADIVAMIGLLEQFDAPIVVDGVRYGPDIHVEDIDLLRIEITKRYNERIERSPEGAIKQIIYES
ncbi:hypothetical protein [Paenibacillus terrigena]|uniref:hypothetical protein n=1 Tax=Paenibacillus terrigena TaxID=369333 RepID=UPI0028D72B7C|nr:hypothetical protein [Paenibacillus terrigena]